MHTYALNFKRFEIQQWLEDRKVDYIHQEMHADDTVDYTNQMKVMVERYKRFCERFRVSIEYDTTVKNGYPGKLYALCQHDQ